MAGKWMRDAYGILLSLDKIECIMIRKVEGGFEVRAYPPGKEDEVEYYVLFTHADIKVCEEWRDEFARRHLDIAPPVVLWRDCPQCSGRGTLPIGPDGADETCSFCEGERRVTLEVYESAMREWGLKP
ncbi:hypothetical protein [Symbiobacterium terraclitae]|uniref:hypothetical protein n=1 Tax=Symbiobacterium terraclitae TaxID=557451 RepID=UPI0035B53BB4